MIRSIRPDFRISTAKDGEDALQFIADNHIDILFTDIRMPHRDGLELIEALGQRAGAIKIVILSVYGQFEYARRALKLGAFDYLLKPLEQRELEEMLRKLEDTIGEERSRLQEGRLLARKLNSAVPVYEQHLLNRWIRAETGEEERAEVEKLFPLTQGGYMLLVMLEKQGAAQRYSPADWEEVKMSIKAWFQMALDALGTAVAFFLDGPRPILAAVLSPDAAHEWLLQRDLEQLSGFVERIRLELELTITIGIGGWLSALSDGPGRSFEQAMNALSYSFYCGEGQVILHYEIAYNPLKSILSAVPAETKIAAAITQTDNAAAAGAFQEWLDELLQGQYPDPAHLKERVVYMLLNQVKANEPTLRSEDVNNLIGEIEFRVPECLSLRELQEAAVRCLHRLIACMESRMANKNQKIIQMCKEYLDHHYMDDLSLESVARKYFFSPAYFSSFFKMQTTLTFTEYLLQVRLDKAKQLLKEPSRKVSEIARLVGFRDAGYFTRIFRRETGLSPEEFRKSTVMQEDL